MVPMEVLLRRRGGRWLAPEVQVPGQLGAWMEVLNVETAELSLTDTGITGTARLISRLGRAGRGDLGRGNTKHGHLKSGTRPVLEWHVLRKGVRPHGQA
ncbi:MAG: hypothetical protein ACOC70_02205, partial [bacterium]